MLRPGGAAGQGHLGDHRRATLREDDAGGLLLLPRLGSGSKESAVTLARDEHGRERHAGDGDRRDDPCPELHRTRTAAASETDMARCYEPRQKTRLPLAAGRYAGRPCPHAERTSATSRSSPTSTTARRRSSTPCSGRPARFAPTRTWPSASWTRWTSSV